MKLKIGTIQKDTLLRYRPLGWLILVIIAITVFSFLLLVPKIKEISFQQRALLSERKKLAQVTDKLAALEGLNEYELSTKAQQVLAALPAEKDVPRLLAIVRYLVDLNELELIELGVKPGKILTEASPTEKAGKDNLPFLTFKIKVSGPTDKVGQFFGKISSSAPVMQVGSLTITQKDNLTQAALNLNIFYLPLPQALGSVEQPLPKIDAEENKVYERLARLEVISLENKLYPVQSGKENLFTF